MLHDRPRMGRGWLDGTQGESCLLSEYYGGGMRKQLTRGLAFLLLVLPLGGCGAAALAGAGAATGVYLTRRGAAGAVEGAVADLDRRQGTELGALDIDERARQGDKERTNSAAHG